jgi:hypothetical protein
LIKNIVKFRVQENIKKGKEKNTKKKRWTYEK